MPTRPLTVVVGTVTDGPATSSHRDHRIEKRLGADVPGRPPRSPPRIPDYYVAGIGRDIAEFYAAISAARMPHWRQSPLLSSMAGICRETTVPHDSQS